MNSTRAGWVEPFQFTENQTKLLLKSLASLNPELERHSKAVEFIQKTERVIETWLTFLPSEKKLIDGDPCELWAIVDEEPCERWEFENNINTPLEETRIRIEKLYSPVKKLKKLLNEIPVEFRANLQVEVDAALHLERESILQGVIEDYNDIQSNRNLQLSVYDINPLLSVLLQILEKGIERTLFLKSPGTKQSERFLIYELAVKYFEVYSAPPKYSHKKTKFRKYMSTIAYLFSISIGEKVISSTLHKDTPLSK